MIAGNAVSLKGHPQPVFQDFEIYLRAEKIPEGDKKVVLKTDNLVFMTDEIPAGIYEVQ